jgi:mono/diheme cytochrome c family protein
MRWKKTLAMSGTLLLLFAAGAALYLVFFATPRMRVQENIRTYEAPMPLAPPGSIPLDEHGPAVRQPAAGSLPLPAVDATEANIGRGAVYYGYYCLFCHGEEGDGEGPVGQSYLPKPVLRAERVAGMSEAELLEAMLLGTGHEPVVNRVVPPDSYAFLVLYIRDLIGRKK